MSKPSYNPSKTQSQFSSGKKTLSNFFIKSDKEKKDEAQDRLIHSVNAVTELLKANTELRDTLEK